MLAGASDGVGDGLQRPLQTDLRVGEAELRPPASTDVGPKARGTGLATALSHAPYGFSQKRTGVLSR